MPGAGRTGYGRAAFQEGRQESLPAADPDQLFELFVVQSSELAQVLELGLCIGLVLRIHLGCVGRICLLQGHVTDLALQELLIIAGASLGIKGELLGQGA